MYAAPVILYTAPVDIIGIGSPAIATDQTQTALALWQDFDTNSLYAAFFNGTAWQPYVVLDNNISINPSVGSPAGPQVAMDGSGNGLAVWHNQNGLTFPGNIIASFFNGVSQTWGPALPLTPTGTGGIDPAVAYSTNGTAVAIWLDGADNVIASNYNGSTWTAIPVTISVGPAAFGSLNVGIDSSGNAVAVWSDNTTSEIFSSVYSAGVWSAPQSVSQAPGVISFDFAMSLGGTAVTTWIDASNVAQYSIFNGGAWSAPTPYQSNIFNLSAAIDDFGNVLLLVVDGNSNAFSYTLPAGGTISSPDLIGSATEVSADVAGYADNGRGFASGTVPTGEGNAITATFTIFPSPPPPPSGRISGRVCKNKFAHASERVKTITWVPNPDPLTVSYYVRRNGQLIATIPASGPFKFVDQKRCKSRDVYVVTAVDAAGTESNPLTISIK